MPSTRLSSPMHRVASLSSSPDPLAESTSEETSTPSRRRRASSAVSMSLAHSRKTSEIILSPSKMVTDQMGSPWRIKVTVEAEPDSEATSRQIQRTTRTMKVPLRDETVSAPSSRAKVTTRQSTRKTKSPVRATRSRRQSVTDLDVTALGDDADEDAWSPVRSSKKRTSSKPRTSKKGRKSEEYADFEIRQDSVSIDGHEADIQTQDVPSEMKELDLNRLAARSKVVTAKEMLDRQESQNDKRNVSVNSAVSYPSPSPSISDHVYSEEAPIDGVPIGLDTVMESEGFTMIDLDTLPSVKHMRNTPDYPAIPEETTQESALSETSAYDETVSDLHAPSIAVTNEDSGVDLTSSPPALHRVPKGKPYSIGHLQLPSSTNVQRHRLVTPMPIATNPFSSPKLPSPPRAPAATTVERSPIHSGQTVQAATVLQLAVTPEHSLLDPEPEHVHQEPTLFGGFSNSMQRELRAELRFGEELGKKQIVKYNKNVDDDDEEVFSKPHSTTKSLPQVWRGENIVRHSSPNSVHSKHQTSKDPVPSPPKSSDAVWAENQHRLEKKQQEEREDVIRQAQASEVVVVDEDHDDDGQGEGSPEYGNADETMGDIWLAEAKHASSSPKEARKDDAAVTNSSKGLPQRKLIPSPWKRGQQIDSPLSSPDASFSGILWKQSGSAGKNARFGDAIIADPDRVTRRVSGSNRRRSGMYDADEMVIKTPRRISERPDSDDDQDIEDENFDAARKQLSWRSAADVIEEETNELEESLEPESEEEETEHEVGTTKLYETNLEHVPEQDLSSSPHIKFSEAREQAPGLDHDSTYSSISQESSIEEYRQRTSLSPSKERPHTPRSAFKGTRANFGALQNVRDDKDDLDAKKVVWARRSKCMNDLWEEDTQSVRSSQTTLQNESSINTTTSVTPVVNPEPSFEVNAQPVQHEPTSKGWFGWFDKDGPSVQKPTEAVRRQSAIENTHPASLDGPTNDFVKHDELEDSDYGFEPTSRQTAKATDSGLLHTQTRAPEPDLNPNDPKHKDIAASPKVGNLHPSPKVPSYLLPPSYPSDPVRNSSIPLTTSGAFTNTHFRTLHIIYAKSTRSRFHAPMFPDEIRPRILDLVGDWVLEIDESATMGEDGDFAFSVGPSQARVLERFMREVEHGYFEAGEGDVRWGWTVEELAEKLGRIAVGEKVRDEEKAASLILRSARKGKGGWK